MTSLHMCIVWTVFGARAHKCIVYEIIGSYRHKTKGIANYSTESEIGESQLFPICLAIFFKVDGYTFRGSNFVIFIVASNINWCHLIKERICFHWSKFFHLKVDLETFRHPGKQTESYENCLSLKI